MLRILLFTLISVFLFSGCSQKDQVLENLLITDDQSEPIVIGSLYRIASSVYGDDQVITVRLPRGYSDNPEKSYPVLFSVDGGPEQDFELLAGIAAEAEFSTSFEPFILIGVKTEDRYSQLTPDMTRLPLEKLKENFGDRLKPGGAEKFRDYLESDVIPWATKRYRTDRKIVTSVSLGGLFILDTFLERPELFDDYIALTPSLWWDAGRIVDEAAQHLSNHDPSDRRLYFTMGDEGVGNNMGDELAALVETFRNQAPDGLKWAFVDRSDSEEHRTMALISWLDAMRTLYLTPSRTGSPLSLLYDNFEKPTYSADAKASIDLGKCSHANAKPVTFSEKNANVNNLYGMCVLMKPGSEITAGNFKATDFGFHKKPK